jgi:septal ring factor EnvC (AmiA/AmiB activator)
MKKVKKDFIKLIIILFFFSPSLSNNLPRVIQDKESEVKLLRKKILEKKRALQKLSLREDKTVEKIKKLERKLQKTYRQLKKYTDKVLVNERRLAEKKRLFLDKTVRLKYYTELLFYQLRRYYNLMSSQWFLASNEGILKIFSLRVLKNTYNSHQRLIKERERLKLEQKTLEEKRQNLLRKLTQEKRTRRRLQDAARKEHSRLKEIKSAKSRTQKELKKVERKVVNLEKLIQKLKVKLDEARGSVFAKHYGKLRLPLRGRIEVYQKGFLIKGAGDVKAIFSGKVIFAGQFEGYKNLVIIDHGGFYFSVYGCLTSLEVKEGDKVKTGQKIGSLREEGLYVEIRKNGIAQRALDWFKKP